MMARHNRPLRTALAGACAALVLAATGGLAAAETRVTYKSAKPGSSYYQTGVELAEAIKAGTDGGIVLTVEESQGSVQNVMEAARRTGNYVFTSPPALVTLAREGKAMFEGRESERFSDIRALFPIPSLTMHFVVSAESGVDDITGLAGKRLLLGKGSFGAREGEKYLELFGIRDAVRVADVELSNAVPALRNRRIDAFVTAGSWPAPNVVEAAAGGRVVVVSMTEDQVEKTGRTRLVIPAGTYPGQDEDVVTTSLPVVAYATTDMDEETAYALTKAFWEKRADMAETAPWWRGVTPDMLENVTTEIHPGALKYYEEAGIDVPDAAR